MTVKSNVIPERSQYGQFRPDLGADGALTINVVMVGKPPEADPRGYPKHARSLTARAVRQRMLLLAAVLCIAATSSALTLPSAFRHLVTHFHRRTDAHPSPSAAARARTEAATWVAKWVSSSADVACDPGMCMVLAAHGVSPGEIWPIVPGTTGPLDAMIVVETPAVRNQFGRKLATVYAPAVLASFGAARVKVAVRVVAGGAARFERQLRTDVVVRRSAGTALLQKPGIVVNGQARAELALGEVDSRLLTDLAALVHRGNAVSVLSFGGAGPGASPGMPLLSMRITPLVRPQPGEVLTPAARNATSARALGRILRFFRAQKAPLSPASVAHWLGAGGQTVVQVNFGAPTQFGVFDRTPAERTPLAGPSKSGTRVSDAS